MKGLNDEEFNPLAMFKKAGKKVPKLKWCIPEEQKAREEFFEFLEFNETVELYLSGGQ